MYYKIAGIIQYKDEKYLRGDIVAEALLPIWPKLKHRPRIFGYDIRLEQDDLEIDIETTDEIQYFIGIYLKIKTKEELLNLLEKMKTQLLSINTQFTLDYYQTTEDGDELEDEIEYYENFPK
jgi:hypothetical protein